MQRSHVAPLNSHLQKKSAKPAWTVVEESGEPGDDALEPTVCSQRWKNAKAEHFKTAPGMFDQTGVFVCLCRHGLLLWLTEMIKSGELYVVLYALCAARALLRC